ncbi:MAG: tryptophan halogenase family protein [Thalassotalea sp.]
MQTRFENIIVLGGGTAGWLTACILARKLNSGNERFVNVTLIESADIPTIGVGEGTVPTMRQTLQLIGASETDFFKECDATFKQSIKFVDWLHAPSTASSHSYHHLFNYPHTPGFDLTPYWLLNKNNQSYAQSVSFQSLLCEELLAPKKITQREYQASAEYAYHLDASKFSQFLAKHGTEKLGINRVFSTIKSVELDDNGLIKTLVSDNAEQFNADFFVDCSGFASRLIDQALHVKFISKADQLLVDTAVAMQVPYADPECEIAPFTIATAKEAGWIWDIGLTQRKGVGYVYSSAHTSHEQAEAELRRYVGAETDKLMCRKIPMNIGHREHFWYKNCVAIGLSAGFVEPLEATALLIVEASAKLLADKLPNHVSGLAYAQRSYNEITRYAWERVIDFIKLHYFLSKRTDSDFWLDNTNPQTAPDSLLEKLDYWRHNVPTHEDFFSKYEVFQLENYQYVLYGMDFFTNLTEANARYPLMDKALVERSKLQKRGLQLTQELNTHRELINKIKQFGLSKI